MNQLTALIPLLIWFSIAGLAVGIIIAVCYIRFLMPKQSTGQAVGVGILAVLIFAACGAGAGAALGAREVFSRAVDAVIGEVQPRLDAGLGLAGLNPASLPAAEALKSVQKVKEQIVTAAGTAGKDAGDLLWNWTSLAQVDVSDFPSLKKSMTSTGEILADLKHMAEKKVMGILPWIIGLLLVFPLAFAFLVHIMVKSEKKEAQKVQDAADNGHIRL